VGCTDHCRSRNTAMFLSLQHISRFRPRNFSARAQNKPSGPAKQNRRPKGIIASGRVGVRTSATLETLRPKTLIGRIETLVQHWDHLYRQYHVFTFRGGGKSQRMLANSRARWSGFQPPIDTRSVIIQVLVHWRFLLGIETATLPVCSSTF
jgi:hypothetical protein